MDITIFSFTIAILWCNAYIIAVALIRKRDSFLLRFSYIPLLFLIATGVIRVLSLGELPYTVVITSETMLPAIFDFFRMLLFPMNESGATVHVYHIVITVWAIGSVFSLIYIAVRQILLYQELNKTPQIDDARIVSIMEEVVRESGKCNKVKIIQPEWNTSIRLAGYFKPMVLMTDIPFSDDELKLMLQHEWTHFLHKDIWTKLLMNILLAIFWWNPFVYILRRDLDQLLEVKCDLNTVSKLSEERRRQYVRSIQKIRKKMKEGRSKAIYANCIGVVGSNSVTEIGQRCRLVLDYRPDKRWRVISNTLICGIIALSFVVSYMFVVQPIYYAENDLEGSETYTIMQGDSYIMTNEDGTYSLYLNGKYVCDVDSIDDESIAFLPIKQAF